MAFIEACQAGDLSLEDHPLFEAVIGAEGSYEIIPDEAAEEDVKNPDLIALKNELVEQFDGFRDLIEQQPLDPENREKFSEDLKRLRKMIDSIDGS